MNSVAFREGIMLRMIRDWEGRRIIEFREGYRGIWVRWVRWVRRAFALLAMIRICIITTMAIISVIRSGFIFMLLGVLALLILSFIDLIATVSRSIECRFIRFWDKFQQLPTFLKLIYDV